MHLAAFFSAQACVQSATSRTIPQGYGTVHFRQTEVVGDTLHPHLWLQLTAPVSLVEKWVQELVA
jgi:hypothetical protein